MEVSWLSLSEVLAHDRQNADIRARDREIIGGSQREERLDVRMTERGIDKERWYHDLRRYRTVPHAGFYRVALTS